MPSVADLCVTFKHLMVCINSCDGNDDGDSCCVHGKLLCDHEPTNEWDGYAIAVIKDGIVMVTFHTFAPCFFE